MFLIHVLRGEEKEKIARNIFKLLDMVMLALG